MDTQVHVLEYGHPAKHYKISGGVKINTQCIWDACMDALAPYKSQQKDQSIARPGAWSTPGLNLGATAVSQRWNQTIKAQPHVHAGSNIRAAIGCRTSAVGVGDTHYEWISVYIGEFAKS